MRSFAGYTISSLDVVPPSCRAPTGVREIRTEIRPSLSIVVMWSLRNPKD